MADNPLPEPGTGPKPLAGARRRIRRRGVVKTAVVAAVAVAAANGYVAPTVRPLEIPVAHAFSF